MFKDGKLWSISHYINEKEVGRRRDINDDTLNIEILFNNDYAYDIQRWHGLMKVLDPTSNKILSLLYYKNGQEINNREY